MRVILRSHQFDTAEQVVAFLGVVPVEKSSGTSVRGKPKLSKNGPPEIWAKMYVDSMCGL
nr:IS110 family transposase [Serratia proteamaculans]